jgi:tripartite-type tricarboxylate transporter receptor subunit TctC
MAIFRSFVALGVVGLTAIVPAAAQNPAQPFPNRTIRIIVPFPAGGPTDVISRFIGQRLTEEWGQPVVIENRPGGNTAIGAQQVAKAPADGYTLLAAMDTTIVLNPLTSKNLPYDPFKDFDPITLAAQNISVIVVRASDGPKSIKELIAKAKANPGKLNFGAGTINSRLAGLLFAKLTGIELVMIPYKGSADTVQGVMSGTVDFGIDGASSSLPLIQSGQFRALAKLSPRPLPVLPDLPSLADAAEQPAIGDISTWIGFYAPAGTPRAIIDKIQREVAKMYADPVMAERLRKASIIAVSSTPEELDRFARSEMDRWSQVVKDAGAAALE